MAAQTYTFTNAGATGQYGPTQSQVNSAYNNTTLDGKVTVTGDGIQEWVVLQTGLYKIDAFGAQGGTGSAGAGGRGARMQGEFYLQAGQKIKIVVGQMGTAAGSTGAGGGGTFVVDAKNNNPLIIAGGGGGSSSDRVGMDGVTSTSGTASSLGISSGGTNGNGGGACTSGSHSGGGGGGLLTNGTYGSSGPLTSAGIAFVNGAQGGNGDAHTSMSYGGFGCGGGACNSTVGGGGGGGYSGGAGGQHLNECVSGAREGGGGGGSYNAGSNQSNTAGANTGHGKVEILLITPLGSPNDAGISSIDQPNIYCQGTHNVVVTLKNFGTKPLDSAMIYWSVNGSAQTPYKYAGKLDTFGGSGSTAAQVTIGNYTFTNAQYIVKAWTASPNGATDTININDTTVATLQSSLPPPTALKADTLNPYDAYISWKGGATNTWLYLNLPAGSSLTGTGTSSSTNNVKLTGLSPRTSYDFYVREVCSGGDTSSWSGPLEYRTPCVAPLSGSYTIDKGKPASATNFISFAEAGLSLMECGVSGPVVLTVAAGTYTEQIAIAEIMGASAVNTVAFDGLDSSKAILSYSGGGSNYATLHLNGADYVTFKNMTIQTTASTDGWCVYLSNGAEHNTITNCYLKMSTSATSDVMGVVASNSGTSETSEGNNANYTLIANNLIEGGENGIHLEGSNYGNSIIGNIIDRSYNSGIEVDKQDTFKVLNNTVDNMRTTGGDGFLFSSLNYMFNISGNYVVGNDYGVYISSGNINGSKRSSFHNNVVVSTNDEGFYAIDIENTDIWNNTFFGRSDDAMYMSSCSDNDVQNNIFYFGGTSSAYYAAFITGSTFDVLDNNIYYSTGPNLVDHGPTFTNLADWQSAEPTLNQSSLQLDPGFVNVSGYDFHLNNVGIKPYGVELPGITVDVDGDPRCEFAPTIGADESPLGKAGSVTAVIYPPDTVFVNSPALFESKHVSGALQKSFWYIDDVLITDSIDAELLFANTGQYELKLISRSCSNRDSAFYTVNVINPLAAPVADFISDKNLVSEGDVVTFRSLSTGGPVSFKWTVSPDIYMDDNGMPQPTYEYAGGSDSSAFPVIRFLRRGVYNVCLTVSNGFGSSQECQFATVEVMPRIRLGETTVIRYQKGYLYDDGGPLGDYTNNQLRGILINACASEVFLTFTQFDLECDFDYLRIYDGLDNTGTPLYSCTTNGLTGPGCPTACAPTVNDTFVAKSGYMYIEMETDGGTTAPGFEAYWYVTPGNIPEPVADIILADSICRGSLVTLVNNSQGNDLEYFWDLDDDFTTIESQDSVSTEWAYFITGQAKASLIVRNCAGIDTFTKIFTVYDPKTPVANFTADNYRPTTSDIVTLSPDIVQCVEKYVWKVSYAGGAGLYQFVNGTDSNSAMPQFLFKDTGCWNIELFVSNITGSDLVLKQCFIRVKEPYCLPTVGTLVQDIGIATVKFNTINNASSQGTVEYTSYVSTRKTEIEIGATYDLELGRNTNINKVSWAAWIDWNQDGDFDDVLEDVALEANSSAKTYTTLVSVPIIAKEGPTVLRVAVARGNGTNTPCGQNRYGEFEDYRVIVTLDKTPPVITLIGSSDTTMEQGRTYADPGATAMDNLAGNITNRITADTFILSTGQLVNDLNSYVVRDYLIRYRVVDDAGNVGTAERIVRIMEDTSAPVLTIALPEVLSISVDVAASTYTTPAVLKAEDNIDGDFTGNVIKVTSFDPANAGVVQIIDPVDPAKVGTYTVTYYAADQKGNFSTVTRTVIIYDDQDPVLTLKGINPVTHQIGVPYTDAGLDVSDNYYDEATLRALLQVSSNVDVNKFGTYQYTYTLIDPSGNGPVSITRTVIIGDTIPPVITLDGPATVTIPVNEQFIDPGVSVLDNYGISAKWTAGGSFYANFPDAIPTRVGTFTITYSIEDVAGNISTVDRTVIVVDDEAPMIELAGITTVNVCRWAAYTDAGYTLGDNYDDSSEITVKEEGTWTTEDVTLPGTYSLRYKATDSSGNVAYSEARIIEVLDAHDTRCATGIDEGADLEQLISIYPNPNQGIFTVKADLQGKQAHMSIVNMTGQEVAQVTEGMLSEGIFTVDLSRQAAGIYLLKVTTSDHSFTKQIVVTK